MPKMKLVAIVSLITSIFVELSYRISYSTGKLPRTR